MEMIPAPSRVLRQWSTWILSVQGIGDLVHALLAGLLDLHYVTGEQLALINLVLSFAAGMARLIQQNIPMTEEQKTAVIEATQAAPTKPPKDPQ